MVCSVYPILRDNKYNCKFLSQTQLILQIAVILIINIIHFYTHFNYIITRLPELTLTNGYHGYLCQLFGDSFF